MSLANSYKLVTKEDPYHLHKALGAVCLLNFIYRFTLLATQGSMDLHSATGITSVILHGALSVSSLIFHLPRERNPMAPMIYPEFRVHSILFALRSILCTLVHLSGLHVGFIPILCFGTMIAADLVTAYYKRHAENGKTIANMPFDESISEAAQKKVIYMNSSMQIGATLYMLGSANSAFAPLAAIQLAAFLMTLVRKGIISCNSWHRLYALSLWANILLTYSLPLPFVLIHGALYNLYTLGFFVWRTNKYLNWCIMFLLYGLYQVIIARFIPDVEATPVRHVIVGIYLVFQARSAAALFI